jgi:hypothetical protein
VKPQRLATAAIVDEDEVVAEPSDGWIGLKFAGLLAF